MKQPGFWRRTFAFTYDFFIIFAILMVGTYAILPLTGGSAVTAGNHWYQLYLFMLMFAYWGGFWYWRQQTIGMLAWNIKIVTADEKPASMLRLFLRFICAGILSIFGLLFCVFDKNKQAIYDILAGTKIVVAKVNQN